MTAELERAITDLAGRQHGFVTRRQLLRLGMSHDSVDRRIATARLIRIYAGVYAVGHRPLSPVARAAGAVLACGDDAVLSHSSAASLWGFVKNWKMPFEVTTPSVRVRRAIRTHRSSALTPTDVRTQLGIRVTSPARTILDVAPDLDKKALTRMVNEALLSSHLRRSALAELLSRCPRHPGAKRLTGFVEAPTGPTRSDLEDQFVEFTRQFGLPQPEINALVAGYEVDALFRAERLIVELDGFAFHASRAKFERDRERDADMLALNIETVRVTSNRLTAAPVKEADRLFRILSSRREFLRGSEVPLPRWPPGRPGPQGARRTAR